MIRPYHSFATAVTALALLAFAGIFASSASAQGTVIDFSSVRPGSDATRAFLSKGVIFKAADKQIVVTPNSLSGNQAGLCAAVEYEMAVPFGTPVRQTRCENFSIHFVSPGKPNVPVSVSGITLQFVGVGGISIIAHGKAGATQYEWSPFLDAPVQIKEAASWIELRVGSDECDFCSFSLIGLSFGGTAANDLCNSSTSVGQSHRRLMNEDYGRSVYDGLDRYNKGQRPDQRVKLQQLNPGKKTYADEFKTTVRMPADGSLTPGAIFHDMQRRLDTAGAGSGAAEFSSRASFSYFKPEVVSLRPGGLPTVGDIFQVKITPIGGGVGLDNGDVMMTDLSVSPQASRFRYSTLNNQLPHGNKEHPNNGSREYGFETLPNGDVNFYVRGVDQWSSWYEQAPDSQDNFWKSFLRGIDDRIKKAGGRVLSPPAKSIDSPMGTLPPCHVPTRPGYAIEY